MTKVFFLFQRYLLNDACVLNNIPLVSGSALRFEGQLTVYNYKGGPTYRFEVINITNIIP